jgi:hypothetical protein
MINRVSLFVSALLSAMAFTACTADLDVHLDSMPPVLVVDAVVTTDTTTHYVYLKTTGAYFSSQPADVVTGAIITLDDGQHSITLEEDKAEKGTYKTPPDYYGVTGRTYTLTISNVDIDNDGEKETYTASSTMNAVPPVEKINVVKDIVFYENVWAVNVWMHDPAGVSNYYLTKAFKNDVCLSDTIAKWNIVSDCAFNGNELSDKTIMYLPSTYKSERIHAGDKVGLEVCGISKDYYEFIRDVKQESSERNPLFGGQPANVRTNIKQIVPVGATGNPRGYFAAYSISRAQTVFR